MSSKGFKTGANIGIAVADFKISQVAIVLALICILNVVQVSWVWLPLLLLKLRLFMLLGGWLIYNVWYGVVMGGNSKKFNDAFTKIKI